MTYELPWKFEGGGINRIAHYAFAGWKLAGLLTLASGPPMTITHPNGRPLRIRNPRIDGPVDERLGDQRDGTRILNPYFDTGAFQAFATPFVVYPTPCTRRAPLPGVKNLNLNLFKRIPIRERLALELRMESSAFTNTPNFSPPGNALNNASTFGVINGAEGSPQHAGRHPHRLLSDRHGVQLSHIRTPGASKMLKNITSLLAYRVLPLTGGIHHD